ncbi:MAG: AAA family ATPase, partial [Christensenellaceae bacterium]|nr:AAA family ATPase [Christensenellaceae bacterium]
MDKVSQEINQLLIDGSKKYYEYLDETGGGVIVFSIVRIERVFDEPGKKCLYKLKMGHKLKNTEALLVRIREEIYLPTSIQILFWDETKNDLMIQIISKEAKEELVGFENYDPRDVSIIVNLKYLVRRTGDWFERNDIVIPHEIKGVDSIYTAMNVSDCQARVIDFCLNNPFTYVWGAPGTGKTKYVLTNAVINLFRLDRRVLVVAPTNNAIEQSLRCIITQLDKEGISRSNIIRLGFPSKAFADEFPEACEIRGISKTINALTKRKERLSEIAKYKTKRDKLQEILNIIKNGATGESAEYVTGITESLLVDLEKQNEEKKRMYAEYEDDDIESIQDEISKLDDEIEQYTPELTAERVNSAKIIGCTIDGYIAQLISSARSRSIDHIFLDEAGYCSLAKGATLFNKGVPITFLGDHFQLPPVCEMSSDSIRSYRNQSVFVWDQSVLSLPDLVFDSIENAFEKYAKKLPPSFDNISKINLDQTYRFGANLLRVLCQNIYHEDLTSCAEREGVIIEVINARRSPMNGEKRTNVDEAEAIREYIR